MYVYNNITITIMISQSYHVSHHESSLTASVELNSARGAVFFFRECTYLAANTRHCRGGSAYRKSLAIPMGSVPCSLISTDLGGQCKIWRTMPAAPMQRHLSLACK